MNKKLAVFFSLCAATAVLATGCTIGDTTIRFGGGPGFSNVFRIGNHECPKSEALIYLANAKNLYGVVGDVSLWTGEYPTDALEDGIRDNVLNHLARVYTLDIYAEEKEIELTDIEANRVSEAADEYYESLSENEKKVFGVSRSDINDMYLRYGTAMKVYEDLMNQVDEEVSEDEARIMDAYVLFTSDESKAKKVKKALGGGGDFMNLLGTYGEGDHSLLSFGRGTYESAIEDEIFALDDDEISGMIRGSDGYYFVMCVDKYDEAMSEANKAFIVTKRKEEVIENIILSQYDKYDSLIDEEQWEKLDVDTDAVETDSFFSVLESHLRF